MKKITSFEIDHTKLEKGLYISRTDDNLASSKSMLNSGLVRSEPE
ncbi:MAG: S-ribosylhomocysteine lyase [Elusimicrobiota bacterium]|nr:S-ribosylhomocysteine lyase [Elusimicrobiota bacterium]